MQHLRWSFVGSIIWVAIVTVGEFLVWQVLMEISCSVDCFPPEHEWCLGVKYHSSCFLCNSTNHSLCDPILMVGVRWTELDGCITCGQMHSEEPIVEFSSAIITPETFDVVSSGVNLGLLVLVGGDASLLFLIRKDVYRGPVGVVINE